MSLHNTQCPHCFTTYVISDEQYRVSEGMVRCGTCRERFQARFLKDDISTPKFDPREAFIEPISDDAEQINRPDPDNADQIIFINSESDAGSNIQLTSFEDNISNSINSDLSLEIDDNAPITPVDSSKLSAEEMLVNIRTKQAREKKQKELAKQQELNLPSTDSTQFPDSFEAIDQSDSNENSESDNSNDVVKRINAAQAESLNDHSRDSSAQENLISEVDTLVNSKLAQSTLSASSPRRTKTTAEATANNELKSDFRIKENRRKTSIWAWIFSLPLLIIVSALIALLVYQLWMKQIIAFDNNSRFQKEIEAITIPLAQELEKIDIKLPVRRNLSQLELLSARTEAHPTRSSTTLLKVDILNRAQISQPLPWLEMTLTDADGGLVSLRNLSPNDYIYNNNINNQIGSKELKKVTIELLSFPKQATGYELKMLNR